MFNNNQIEKVVIDQEAKKLYVYCVQYTPRIIGSPLPPPSYYRNVYSFDNLKFIKKEHTETGTGLVSFINLET